MKVFLVAITPVRRVRELQVLVFVPPYKVFYKDKVYLHLHLKFVTKVVLKF